MSLPTPRTGLVICYAYLWADEYRRGLEEGLKARPCAIVAALRRTEHHTVVTVVPVTHAPPRDPSDAVELPSGLKVYLGLDNLPSWIMLTESNDFIWPGVDLRPIPHMNPRRFDFGVLPPRFFTHLRERFLDTNHRLRHVPRGE